MPFLLLFKHVEHRNRTTAQQQNTNICQKSLIRYHCAIRALSFVHLINTLSRLLMDILYKMDPMKIMNLRVDSLSQILNVTNIHRNLAITIMWALGVPKWPFWWIQV